MKKRVVLLVALAALSQACSNVGVKKKTQTEKLLDMGYSMDYIDGYKLGCDSVKEAVPEDFQGKDEQRYLSDKEYARGWRQGVATCQNSYGEISREYWKERQGEMTREQRWNEVKK